MLLTCCVVVLRYLFGIGSIALQESIVYLHATVFMLGIAATLRAGQHVRVDILYSKRTPRQKAIIDVAGTVCLLLPVSGFILYTSFSFVHFSWSLMETSAEPGGLPIVFVLKTLIPVMAALLILQGTSEALRAIRLIVLNPDRPPEAGA